MPQPFSPVLSHLHHQIAGIMGYYQRMLDDEFLFASAAQVPQVITIFERIGTTLLPFNGGAITLPELLTLIAYRYGFNSIRTVGHGGYALVIGHDDDDLAARPEGDIRRVLRFVPEHHVQDVTGNPDHQRAFDVRLGADNQPIRDPACPLILSDLFLLPRHTTRLAFYGHDGNLLQAGGYPAVMHCQLLPEVLPLNAAHVSRAVAEQAGDILETALASLGVSVADAHGGNGGLLLDSFGRPLLRERDGRSEMIPVVLDYGYYSEIGPQRLGGILARCGVPDAALRAVLEQAGRLADCVRWLDDPTLSAEQRYAEVIRHAALTTQTFGRLLHQVQPSVLSADLWLDHSAEHWRTIKERSYPPLQDQARLNVLYPVYDEMILPQHIEHYPFVVD